MKLFQILPLTILIIMSNLKGFTQSKPKNNPLLEKSNLQYQAPRFDLIKDEHYEPAFEYALKEHDEELEKIINNTEKATFENTVLALEKSGEDLNRATSIFIT